MPQTVVGACANKKKRGTEPSQNRQRALATGRVLLPARIPICYGAVAGSCSSFLVPLDFCFSLCLSDCLCDLNLTVILMVGLDPPTPPFSSTLCLTVTALTSALPCLSLFLSLSGSS